MKDERRKKKEERNKKEEKERFIVFLKRGKNVKKKE